MTTDRAGPKGPSTKGERDKRWEIRMGIFGFYTAVLVDYVPPWMPPKPVLQAMLEQAETSAKLVGCLTPPPES